MPVIPKTMSFYWVCCLLSLGALLLSGQSVEGAEEKQFRTAPGPPSPEAVATAMRLSRMVWQKKHSVIYHQAHEALRKVVEYFNKKHNSTFDRAPGESTHIMVETAMGRVYHVNTVLVNVKCPENQTNVNLKDCQIQPNSKKLECKAEVIQLVGFDTPVINDEGCEEYQPLLANLKPSDMPVNIAEEEEATPYV